jgi:hypothetical protein
LIADDHVPDDLTLAVVSINAWNRIAISFRQETEMCRPAQVNPRGHFCLAPSAPILLLKKIRS